MLQLFDEVRRQYSHTQSTFFRGALDSAILFRVDNVARWFVDLEGGFGLPDGSKISLAEILKSLPNIAPVAPAMWFEYAPIHSASRAEALLQGALVAITFDRATSTPESLASCADIGITLREDARWILAVHSYMLSKELGPNGRNKVYFGDFIDLLQVSSAGEMLLFYPMPHPLVPEPKDHMAKVIEEEGLVSLAALCFMHCKNVTVTEQHVSRQQRRAAERAGQPVVVYKTLDIGPMTKVLRDEGGIATVGAQRALHICRGHFAHYTPEKPLFGKHSGTFYVPMHTRGSAAAGRVEKDYRVLAPSGVGS